jgi:hypothetical protein
MYQVAFFACVLGHSRALFFLKTAKIAVVFKTAAKKSKTQIKPNRVTSIDEIKPTSKDIKTTLKNKPNNKQTLRTIK